MTQFNFFYSNGLKVKVADVTFNFLIQQLTVSSKKQPCDWIRYHLSVGGAFYVSCHGDCGLDLDSSLPSQCIHSLRTFES